MIHPWTDPILDSVRARLERLPHALLIHGPRGVGKLALAERIARLLLCEHADPGKRPCGSCSACRWLAAGNHPDLRRLEPEILTKEPPPELQEEAPREKTRKPSVVIKIEQVRELADFLYVGSHRGRLRVALVHPAEDMNENASNALLKGLEEPPAGAVFLLVSHRPPGSFRPSAAAASPFPYPSRLAMPPWPGSRGRASRMPAAGSPTPAARPSGPSSTPPTRPPWSA